MGFRGSSRRSEGMPIVVEVRDGQPCLINYNGRTYYTERLLEHWKEEGRSWRPTDRRECFRVKTSDPNDGAPLVLEVYYSGARWYLAGVLGPEAGEMGLLGESCMLGESREQGRRPYRIRRIYERSPRPEESGGAQS